MPSSVRMTFEDASPGLAAVLGMRLPCPVVVTERLAARRVHRPRCGSYVRYSRIGLPPQVFSRTFRMTAHSMRISGGADRPWRVELEGVRSRLRPA